MVYKRNKGRWVYDYYEEGRFLPDKLLRLSDSKDPERAVLEWYFYDVFLSQKPVNCKCCSKPVKEVCVINNLFTYKYRNVCLSCAPKIVGENNAKKFVKSLTAIDKDLKNRICPELLKFSVLKKIVPINDSITLENLKNKRKLTENEAERIVLVNKRLLKFYKYKNSLHYDSIRLLFEWAKLSEKFNIHSVIIFIDVTESLPYNELRRMNKFFANLKHDTFEPPMESLLSEFDFVGKNVEGLVKVKYGKFEKEKCGFADAYGNIVIPLIYSSVRDFQEDLAAVRTGTSRNGKWGFINKSGTLVIPFIFDRINSFKGGLAKVKHDGKWCVIDKLGNKLCIL